MAFAGGREWHALHMALDFMPTDTEYPYTALYRLMLSMQTAGVSALLLIASYSLLRNVAVEVFLGLLVAVTTWALFLLAKMSHFLSITGSKQIAMMLRDVLERRKSGVGDATSPKSA